MASILVEFLTSATFRRVGVTLIGIAVPYLNKKFGWNIDDTQVLGVLGLIAGYLVQSVTNEMQARRVGATAAAAVVTPDDAVKVLAETPK